jgi:hypothetical protein
MQRECGAGNSMIETWLDLPTAGLFEEVAKLPLQPAQ